MQLALCVQLPQQLGGAFGSACFLSTSWTLPTERLVEIINHHPGLSPAVCGLASIHTMKTPTIPLLLHVLSETFPALVEANKGQPDKKPIKLLVIDAITELFRNDEMVSSVTLANRSKSLQEIATLLHMLANEHGLAVVVVNEVSEVFDRPQPPSSRAHEVSYKDQARLFSRANTLPGENTKQAALGLVWANQVNARMMLTRTSRMRVLDDIEYRPAKRRRMAGDLATSLAADSDDAGPIRIRRLSVIFNSVAQPASLDYIITAGGFVALEVVNQTSTHDIVPAEEPQRLIPNAALEEVCPLDLPLAVNISVGPSSDPSLPSSINAANAAISLANDDASISLEVQDAENGPQNDDEWEAYWKDDDLFSDIYTQVNLDAIPRGSST
jgi:DNA repair protein RAD57